MNRSAHATRGVVSAGDPQTAAAGAALLRQGGNAVDAAIASAFAAFVCELPLCSPLGGGVMLVELAGGEAHAIDMFARAPGVGGPRPASMDFEAVDVSFESVSQIFHVGRASVAVPLALPGLLAAHARWGVRPLAEVVAPAVALGRDGFVLGPGVAYVSQLLVPILDRTEACRALYLDDSGSRAKAGATLRNPDLANTLASIAKTPAVVRDLFAALARESGPAEGGLITDADVAAAEIVDAGPIRIEHRGWELLTMPAPSTGGALVALGLRLHEGDHELAYLSPEHVLSVARVQEILLEERPTVGRLGPLALEDANVERLRARLAARRGVAPMPDNRLGSTTHMSALDEHGIGVSLTLTNGEGSGHVLPGTGMVTNNLLGEEDIHPDGFHLDPPGAPLRTMMAPTLLRSANRRVALGSGGSNRLRNAILQVALALVEHGVDAERAVQAPRLQLEARPDRTTFRAAFEKLGLPPESVAALLAAYPHDPAVFAERNLYFGGVHVASATGDVFSGSGDPRRGGATAIV